MANQNLNFTITAKDLTQGTFRKLNQSLGLVRKALFNFKVGLTAVAGAAGIGLLVKSSLQSIDTLGKTAQKLGVTSQALQKLRYASNLAGVETRTVDMAVQRFTRRLSEAANGTGEAKDALKELGLNAKELAKQPLDKQMLKLADAFDGVQSSGDKVRLAFKLFDSEGVAFVNTLEGGSAALQQMFQDAEGLGFILSSSSVKGVEEANDAMMKLGVMFKGVADQITAGLAPAFRVIVDLIRDKLVKAIETAGGMQNFAKALALAVVNMAERISISIQGFVNRIIRGLNFLIDAAKALGSVIDNDTLKSIERVGTYSFVTAGFFQDLRDAINSTKDATNELINAQNAGNETGNTYRKQLMDLAESAKDVQKNMESAAVRGIKSLEDALVDVTMGTASAKDAFKAMARSIISDLIRIQIQKNITGQIAAGMGGGGGGSNIFSSIGKFFGGFFADGGRPPRNKVSVVGERGAELFVPNGVSGTIVPSGGGGGVVVNQTINLSAGVSQTVRAEVMGMLPQIQEASKAAVLDARRRGGGFASAFGG
jgi:flagellar hook-basal body complex protein FliE